MKTAVEWLKEWDAGLWMALRDRAYGTADAEAFLALAERIQADARAGMVLESELATLKSYREADVFLFRQKIARLESELAKAWEAGRDAAAELADAEGPYASMAIRALQPPGGKAK